MCELIRHGQIIAFLQKLPSCYNFFVNNIFSKWKNGLAKTSKATFSQIASILGTSEISENTFDELEALLIQADIGTSTSQEILKSLKKRQKENLIFNITDLRKSLREILLERLNPTQAIHFKEKPAIILIVGVNGSGKTTTIAKLSYHFINQGLQVILGAADTYRAAAVDQLQIWADRLKIQITTGQEGGDAGAVVYDTVQSAIARHSDIALIDTAGRLHTRYNLMEELKKVYRVAGKAMPGAPHGVWLVLDATTGQNSLQQAKSFLQAVSVDGIILAKLDSSAKGGMVFSIQKELNLPILYAGLGERLEDLEPFNPEAFVDGILDYPS